MVIVGERKVVIRWSGSLSLSFVLPFSFLFSHCDQKTSFHMFCFCLIRSLCMD